LQRVHQPLLGSWNVSEEKMLIFIIFRTLSQIGWWRNSLILENRKFIIMFKQNCTIIQCMHNQQNKLHTSNPYCHRSLHQHSKTYLISVHSKHNQTLFHFLIFVIVILCWNSLSICFHVDWPIAIKNKSLWQHDDTYCNYICIYYATSWRLRVRFPMRSLDFSIDLIIPATLGHCGKFTL
jgi:hypothetical protein